MKLHDDIHPQLAEWISTQKMFFVGTAPLSSEGRVNVSPKGGDAFRILGPLEVAYQDYTGSGAETAAHLHENGRIVIMFCGFEGSPQIVRLHGKGRVHLRGSEEFAALSVHFPENPGTRAIVHISVDRVADSCGMSVPLYEFKEQRSELSEWAATRGDDFLDKYRSKKNAVSIDGLPSLGADPPFGGQ